MGQSSCHELDQVAELYSDPIRGFCSIATQDIKKGTLLIKCKSYLPDKMLYDKSAKGVDWRMTYRPMNDADFVYPNISLHQPDDEIRIAIRTSLKLYESRSSPSKSLNNIEHHDTRQTKDKETTFRCTRNIVIGDELTKRYGLSKWGVYLAMDVYGINPFASDDKPWAKDGTGFGDRIDTVFKILQQCFKEFGHTLNRTLSKS